MPRIDTRASSLSFVYPFLFEANEFEMRSKALDNATWQGAKERLQVWVQANFNVDDMLSYIADFLNPPSSIPATARLWHIERNALQSPQGLGSKADWFLETPGGQIPFVLQDVRLALFRDGVGFLTLYARPYDRVRNGERSSPAQASHTASGPTLEDGEDGVGVHEVELGRSRGAAEPAIDSTYGNIDSNTWLDFIHYFRFIRGQREVKVRAERRVGLAHHTGQPVLEPYLVRLGAPGVSLSTDTQDTFAYVVNTILQSAEFIDNNPVATQKSEPVAAFRKYWYREVFVTGQMLPFVTLFVDSIDKDATQLLLYQVRNFFNSRQQLHPAAEELRLDNPNLIPYVDGQWFVYSLDGGAFVATDAPASKFFRETLPDHLTDQYFLLFLLALQQRFLLLKLQEQVAREWLPLKSEGSFEVRLSTFARIRDALLSFTARSYFAQVMQQEHHHRCYRKWQETFQVERLYQEVKNAINEMYTDLQIRHEHQLRRLAEEQNRLAAEQETRDRAQETRTRRLERTLSLILWVLGVPGLALSIISTGASSGWNITLVAFFGSFLLGLVAFLAINFLVSGWREM